MRAMAEGRYKLVYVAPERLAFEGFRGLLAKLECPLVAVDEAHCISEWGHDFRPEYMQIGQLIAELPDCRVLACTATATPIVRDEILERLGLDPSTPQMVHGFARPNLALRVGEVTSRREREERVDEVLAEAIGTPGADRGRAIVYSPTRRLAEEEAQRLAEAGWRAHAYHAGLSGRERERVQGEFLGGRAEVIVATNAFGMGIDRPDVRVVVHLAPPGSVEAYYQEVGRAGRDGADAIGLLLISPGDMAVRRHLIESDVEGRVPDPETVRHRWNLFLELMRWAEGGSCRHDAILRYFSDEKETLSGCGRCDNCLGLDDAGTTDDEEVSLTVRKALSAVARVHGRFGLLAAAKLLRGADDPRLASAGLTETKTFGVLSDRSEEWLTRLLRRCVTAGWVDFSGGDRPVVVLTDEGARVMRGEHPARLLLPPSRSPVDRRASGGASVKVRGKRTIEVGDLDERRPTALRGAAPASPRSRPQGERASLRGCQRPRASRHRGASAANPRRARAGPRHRPGQGREVRGGLSRGRRIGRHRLTDDRLASSNRRPVDLPPYRFPRFNRACRGGTDHDQDRATGMPSV